MWLVVSGFMVMELVSGLSLANHLAWPKFGLTQGPSGWHVHLSGKMVPSIKDSGMLVIYLLFPNGPPESFQVVL